MIGSILLIAAGIILIIGVTILIFETFNIQFKNNRFGFSIASHISEFHKFNNREDTEFIKRCLEIRLNIKLKILEVGVEIVPGIAGEQNENNS